jgi:hypothetical protein
VPVSTSWHMCPWAHIRNTSHIRICDMWAHVPEHVPVTVNLWPSCKKYLQCSFYENFKNRLNIQKSLCITTKTCTQIQNFKRNYLENYNDSEHAVKTKNAPFFMNFLNMYKKWQLFSSFFSHWTGPLRGFLHKFP